MDKKHLAIALSKLKNLEIPIASLEQYQTPGEIAASILFSIQEDIIGKSVADFGSGNGIFSIGAKMLGAKKVYGIDIDEEAISIAKKNAGDLNIEFIKQDINDFHTTVDTVIMNPPFGVQRKGADRAFLDKAFQVSDTVYVIQKLEAASFIEKYSKDYGFNSELIWTFKFPIRATMEFHTKNIHMVDAGLWKLEKE